MSASAALPSPRTTSVPIQDVQVSAFRIPTESPESDGTFEWAATTIVVVEVHGGGAIDRTRLGLALKRADAEPYAT